MSSRVLHFIMRIAVAIFILPAVTTVWASVGGSISGTVRDPSGRVLANAHVIIRESETGISYETQTDSKGYYTLPILPVGRYVLDVEASGFERYRAQSDCS